MSRNIVIYPNRNTTASGSEPYITFSGTTGGTISLVVEDDGSLVFDGNNGGLFGIEDNKDGLYIQLMIYQDYQYYKYGQMIE